MVAVERLAHPTSGGDQRAGHLDRVMLRALRTLSGTPAIGMA
jgi:hypothetical protein